MITSYAEWKKNKEQQLNEAMAVDVQRNPFAGLRQNKQDLVFFGIHYLDKRMAEVGGIGMLDPQELLPYCGVIVEAEPHRFHPQAKPMVFVSIGDGIGGAVRSSYRGLPVVRKEPRRLRLDVDVKGTVAIPTQDLRDFTSHIPASGGQNLWLYIDPKKPKQVAKLRAVLDQEEGRQPQTGPMDQRISPQDIERTRAALGLGQSAVQATPQENPALQQMFAPQTPQSMPLAQHMPGQRGETPERLQNPLNVTQRMQRKERLRRPKYGDATAFNNLFQRTAESTNFEFQYGRCFKLFTENQYYPYFPVD